MLQRFEKDCLPTENTTIERFQFISREQRIGEPIKDYVADLRKHVSTCKYEMVAKGNLVNELIRDRVVVGLPDITLGTRLLEEGSDLTLEKTIKMISCAEQVKAQCSVLDQGARSKRSQGVLAVKQCRPDKKVVTPKNTANGSLRCQFCGGNAHKRSECPAKDKVLQVPEKWPRQKNADTTLQIPESVDPQSARHQ